MKVAVHTVADVSLVIRKLVSLPAASGEPVPQEERVGAPPEVTTCPFASISKFGLPLFEVVATAKMGLVPFPMAESVANGVVVPSPKNGLEDGIIFATSVEEPITKYGAVPAGALRLSSA